MVRTFRKKMNPDRLSGAIISRRSEETQGRPEKITERRKAVQMAWYVSAIPSCLRTARGCRTSVVSLLKGSLHFWMDLWGGELLGLAGWQEANEGRRNG